MNFKFGHCTSLLFLVFFRTVHTNFHAKSGVCSSKNERVMLEISLAKLSSGKISRKYPEDQFQISKIPRGAAEGYFGDLKLVRGVFSRYPTRYVKNSTRRSRVEFLTYRVGYRTKLHKLPFPRISQNTTRRSRVVFWLIRGNGKKCNFDEIGYGKAKCRPRGIY